MNQDSSAISDTVAQKRKSLGLNRREFASLLGLGDGGERTVSGWERAEHVPSAAKLAAIRALSGEAPFRSLLENSRKKPKFQFIDLFAGIGGIRLPFQEIQGQCVFSSEWDKFAQKTYAANFSEVPHGDITAITASEIPRHDLLLAGFPCQSFSQAGLKKGFCDTRGTMFFEIQRILAHHRPRAFLLENVKQLRGHDKGQTLKVILSILRGEEVPEIPIDVPMSGEARGSLAARLNYQVGVAVLAARNFGVPQNRERVYIMGFDRDLIPETADTDLPQDIFAKLEKRRAQTRLGDVLEPNTAVDDRYTISDRLYEGHKRRSAQHKAKGNGFGFSVFTGDSEYCNTISARYYKDGSEILIDQSDIGKNPRKLTPRECARIQGFPEEFIVETVSDVQCYRQFGNSVAVPVIRAIAKEMEPYLRP